MTYLNYVYIETFPVLIGKLLSQSNIRNSSRNSAESQFGWLVGFYGISTFVGYLTPNLFLYK